MRYLDGHEETGGIKVVFARLVDYPQVACRSRGLIRQDSVDLPNLEILSPAIRNAEDEPFVTSSHGLVYKPLDLVADASDPMRLVPVDLGAAQLTVC